MVKCTRIFIVKMCLVIVKIHAKSCGESCGVVELVQAMLVLKRMYKLIILYIKLP